MAATTAAVAAVVCSAAAAYPTIIAAGEATGAIAVAANSISVTGTVALRSAAIPAIAAAITRAVAKISVPGINSGRASAPPAPPLRRRRTCPLRHRLRNRRCLRLRPAALNTAAARNKRPTNRRRTAQPVEIELAAHHAGSERAAAVEEAAGRGSARRCDRSSATTRSGLCQAVQQRANCAAVWR